VQIIPVEAMYAVVASSYRGLVVLRCCQMRDSRLSGRVLDARSGPVETRLVDCGVGLNTCGEVDGAGCAAFHVCRPSSATCDGTFPTAGEECWRPAIYTSVRMLENFLQECKIVQENRSSHLWRPPHGA
jgi:hypothetical protein